MSTLTAEEKDVIGRLMGAADADFGTLPPDDYQLLKSVGEKLEIDMRKYLCFKEYYDIATREQEEE